MLFLHIVISFVLLKNGSGNIIKTNIKEYGCRRNGGNIVSELI